LFYASYFIYFILIILFILRQLFHLLYASYFILRYASYSTCFTPAISLILRQLFYLLYASDSTCPVFENRYQNPISRKLVISLRNHSKGPRFSPSFRFRQPKKSRNQPEASKPP